MFVKVCGIQTREQVDWAVEAGYNAVGFVMHRPSPRYCDPDGVADMARYAGERIVTVAVGIDFQEVAPVYDAVDYIQIYRYLPVGRLILAGAEHPGERRYSYFLFDSSRGSGVASGFPDWIAGLDGRIILSGGMDRSNVGDIVRRFSPFGIDVSSGVEEERGRKSYSMMKDFIREVRRAGA
ncbi:MAG: hypothetical protein JXA20_03695 [Spirochaetes bacterium]|nr:hypothetical protein [Spirochaetota bacterium]